MRKLALALMGLTLGAGVQSTLLAQDGPRRGGEGQPREARDGQTREAQPGQPGRPGERRPDGGPGELRRPEGGPGGRPEGGPGELRRPSPVGQIDMMSRYVEMVEGYSDLAKDPAASGVAAVVTTGDILRQRSPEEAIAYFEKLLPEVRNDAVRRAIMLQLAEMHKFRGNNKEALDLLRKLMLEAPAGSSGGAARPVGMFQVGNSPRPLVPGLAPAVYRPLVQEDRRPELRAEPRRTGEGDRKPAIRPEPRREGEGDRRPELRAEPRRTGEGDRKPEIRPEPRREGEGDRKPEPRNQRPPRDREQD